MAGGALGDLIEKASFMSADKMISQIVPVITGAIVE